MFDLCLIESPLRHCLLIFWTACVLPCNVCLMRQVLHYTRTPEHHTDIVTGISADQFASIELIGGGSRLITVQKRLTEYLKREMSRTLNSEEAVARGCALQCAMLSPVFKVREFTVNDITKFPIRLSWKNVTNGAATDGYVLCYS